MARLRCVSVAHNDTQMERAQREPTLRLYGMLDGGFIVWCMMTNTEHKCILCCCIQTQPLKWKMWLVCEHWKKQLKCQEGKSAPHKHQKLIWDITEPLKARSLTDSQGPCCSRQGWKTDTVSQHCWCTWQLLVVLHVTLGLFNLIVWCVPVARQHNSRALVNGSPGSNYKWAVYICMTPGIWTTLNQSHIGYSGCWLSDLLLPLLLLSHPPFTISPLSRSPCHVSCLPLLSVSFFVVRLCLHCPHTTFSPLCISQHLSFPWLAQTVGSQRHRKCFYITGSFASHSWCGGGPHAPTVGEGEAGVGESQLLG